MLRSVDSVSKEDRMYHIYPAEFLQQLNAGRLPPALLCLKVGSPVILLRNLCHKMTSLLWNDIKLSWKLHLPEHLFQIFTYQYGNIVTF